ncbi:SAM-dependent methyltransferase [Candidatus Methylacidiphilum fumarolicum]|nr:SAM-dependent methyltransferase [Candidatus Methylacidiphilum fumarolicum]TFE69399.1 hypothetical protein A7K73_05550 [Candidatus Methylacidiphilum fumarolicum]TFE72896.1 SAM-dependent methyltransferase [Candidatus Methylacidiphilum fumarolicum]TFE74639.1 SAM-dependent methyltransferase [Candidatus Methylacidiphilum fumarolicum]TFE77205.1 hypothetical protein A7D33_06525 [Candidatus Methylacidiphilum fumarolicum]
MKTAKKSQSFILSEIFSIIKEKGPMPFNEYMALHLGHPKYGYYVQGTKKRIGKNGDFFTSVSVGTLFGDFLAMQCIEVWKQLRKTDSLWIIETGAGGGELACDIVDWLDKNESELSKKLSYLFLEPFSYNQLQQQQEINQRIGTTDRFFWISGWEELPILSDFTILIANEFLDSLPVKRISFQKGKWMESHVGINHENKLCFIYQPIKENSKLACMIDELGIPKIEGYTTEIHLEAMEWIKKASAKISSSLFFIIDYGLTKEEYFAPWRSNGTLRCYKNHQIFDNPLLFPADCDITTHLNFSLILKAAEESGLESIGWLNQHHFFMGLLEKMCVRDPLFLVKNPKRESWIRKFFMLSHPHFMGENFKFLLLVKNLPQPLCLSGLKFCRSKSP